MSDITYYPTASVKPFIASNKFASFIIGPVGSTKTTAGLIKIAYEAKRMAPCADGVRRSRCVVVRNTRQMLKDSTIKDFLKWFPDGEAGLFAKTELDFKMKFDDVECEVLFRGLDDANDVRRLLSLQISFGVMDEFREINPDIYDALTGRLGRYPDKTMVVPRPEWGVDDKGNPIGGCVDDNGKQMKKVWGMTNPPDSDTFWEEYLSNPPENVEVIIQPSGLSPEADWVKHLDSNYYEDLAVGKSEDWIDVYIHGKFGKSLQGMPVFRAFDKETHVAKEALNWRGALTSDKPLIIGVDAGLNPTATICQVLYDGRLLVHDSITSDSMGALRFIQEKLKPLLANKYPGASSIVIIDPAAFQRAQTDERTVADIFKAHGFLVKPARTNSIAARLAAGEQYMTRIVDGKPSLLIDPCCIELIQALRSKYRYKVNTKGERDTKPEKSHPWSDLCFVAGTPVLTPYGYVAIERLDIGNLVVVPDMDRLAALGPGARRNEPEMQDDVVGVGSRLAEVIRLTFTDEFSLTCTLDHPFAVWSEADVVGEGSEMRWVDEGENPVEYIPASELTPDHRLITYSGARVQLAEKTLLSDPHRVYNLTTERTHVYYAGGLLVHNCDSFTYACLHADGGQAFGGNLTTSARREVKKMTYAW